MSISVAFVLEHPELTPEQVFRAISNAPGAELHDGVFFLQGEYRIRIAPFDPSGEIFIELADWHKEGSIPALDRLYDYLVETTPWGMETLYDDVDNYFDDQKVTHKERRVLTEAAA
ncbi:hypothetical protein [Corynebacterium oculi]|uniref:Uncharacterized protein n=1 Tax=Corynebacterium oculi TaxID=1544416 RepID=A0A0Q0TZ57_9CORY|nr:hypothetical protein [Corynebacterium oculi]KQB84537.1 hypothetical protein Cocul_01340 [Corynebacterium oculi]